MSTRPPSPGTTKQDGKPAASEPSPAPTVIAERRRFPRELPKADVVELNSDSAWQAFQTFMDADQEATAPKPGDSAVP